MLPKSVQCAVVTLQLLLPQITVYSGYPAVPSQVTAIAIKESYNPLRPNAGSNRQELPPQVVSAVQQEVKASKCMHTLLLQVLHCLYRCAVSVSLQTDHFTQHMCLNMPSGACHGAALFEQ